MRKRYLSYRRVMSNPRAQRKWRGSDRGKESTEYSVDRLQIRKALNSRGKIKTSAASSSSRKKLSLASVGGLSYDTCTYI